MDSFLLNAIEIDAARDCASCLCNYDSSPCDLCNRNVTAVVKAQAKKLLEYLISTSDLRTREKWLATFESMLKETE